jgi:hypothetical protein
MEKNEFGGACSTYGGEEKYIHEFGGETLRKQCRRRWDYNIKMNLQEVGWVGGWTGLI